MLTKYRFYCSRSQKWYMYTYGILKVMFSGLDERAMFPPFTLDLNEFKMI